MKYLLILLSTLVFSRRYKEEKFIRDLQDLIDELEEGVGDFEEQVGDLENFDTDHFIESAVGESDDFDSVDDASLFRSLWDSESSDYLESVLDSYDESEVGDSYDSDDYSESEVGDSYDSYDSDDYNDETELGDILDSLESEDFDSGDSYDSDESEVAVGDSLDSYDSDDLDMYPRDSFDIYDSDDYDESEIGEEFGDSYDSEELMLAGDNYEKQIGDYSQLYDMTDSAELYKDDSFETAVGEEEIDDYKMLYDGDDYVDLDSEDFEFAVGESDEVALGDSDEFYEEIPTPGEEYAVGDAFLDETVDEDEVPVDEWFDEEAVGDIYSGEDMDLFNDPEEIPVSAHGFDFLQETDPYFESDEEWH